MMTRSRTNPKLEINYRTKKQYFLVILPSMFTGTIDTGIAKHNREYDQFERRPEFILEYENGKLVNPETLFSIEDYLEDAAINYSFYIEEHTEEGNIKLTWTSSLV